MGYSTEFYGSVTLDPPLSDDEIKFLSEFAGSRRMHRKSGPYTIGEGVYGMDNMGEDVLDSNSPDPEQPGLWCQWVPSENDPSTIVWDGGEKFYEATAWMEYIIQHFLLPTAIAKQKEPERFAFLQGHSVDGFFECVGEDQDDLWCIDVTKGIVSTRPGKITYD